MKVLVTSFILIFIATVSNAQRNTIAQEDLIGSWTSHKRIKYDAQTIIVIYKKVPLDHRGSIITFDGRGGLAIDRNLGPRRCGNEVHPRHTTGAYYLDSENNRIEFTDLAVPFYETWDLLWIRENSLAFKVTTQKQI